MFLGQRLVDGNQLNKKMPPRLTPTDLLAWSVLNTATANEDTTQPTRREDYQELDPKWIDIILGRPDAARIKGKKYWKLEEKRNH